MNRQSPEQESFFQSRKVVSGGWDRGRYDVAKEVEVHTGGGSGEVVGKC